MKTLRALWASAVLLLSLSATAKPAVVYINFGDRGELDKAIRLSSDRARKIFPSLGYDFTLVPPAADIGRQIEATLKRVSATHPEELIILTHGHGELYPIIENPGRFPKITTRPGHYVATPQSFVFMNGRRTKDPSPDSREFQNIHVGVGDFKKWLADFRTENPSSPVRMILAECYGGSALRLLNEIPGVRAYSGASDNEKAHLQPDKNGINVAFIDFFMDEIAAARATSLAERDFELFEEARSKWMSFSKTFEDRQAEVPWSPVDSSINSWCEKNPTAAAVTGTPGAQAPGNDRFKVLSHLTLKYEAAAAKSWHARQSCDPQSRAQKLNREGFVKALDVWKDIVEKLKARVQRLTLADFDRERRNVAQQEPSVHNAALRSLVARVSSSRSLEDFIRETQMKLDRSFTCFRDSRVIACGRDVDTDLLTSLFENEYLEDDRLNKHCSHKKDENIAPCLKTLAAVSKDHLIVATTGVIAIFKQTIETTFEACSDQREEYYRKCYDRFWAQSGELKF